MKLFKSAILALSLALSVNVPAALSSPVFLTQKLSQSVREQLMYTQRDSQGDLYITVLIYAPPTNIRLSPSMTSQVVGVVRSPLEVEVYVSDNVPGFFQIRSGMFSGYWVHASQFVRVDYCCP